MMESYAQHVEMIPAGTTLCDGDASGLSLPLCRFVMAMIHEGFGPTIGELGDDCGDGCGQGGEYEAHEKALLSLFVVKAILAALFVPDHFEDLSGKHSGECRECQLDDFVTE
jgi:hypothetical protein